MKSIIEGCFKRPGAVILALVLIFFSGINAFLSIPKEASPDVEIPVAYVSVAYEGISPSDAEKLLTKPLEKQLKTVAGLKKMTSAATEGYTSITVEFDAGEDIDLVLEDVRQAVDDAKKDLPKNAEVIIPAMTYCSTAFSVINANLRPILVDTEFMKSTISITDLKKKINNKTKVIMPVHLYGSVININEIKKLIRGKNIYIIDDCAQAHGAKDDNGNKVGSLADISTFSFYANKHITSGEGGMVVCLLYTSDAADE